MNRIAASATRMRHAAAELAAGAQLVSALKPKPRQNFGSRGTARCMRQSPPAGDRCRPACGRRFHARQSARSCIRSVSASSNGVQQAGVGARRIPAPPRRPSRPRARIPSPSSGMQPPQDDVEQGGLARAVAATRPMRRPAGRLAVAPERISRPAIRTTMLSIASHLKGLITVLALSSSALHKPATF